MIELWIFILPLILIFIIPFPIKLYFMYDIDKLVIKILWKTYEFTSKNLNKKRRDIINKAEENTKKDSKTKKFKQIKYIALNLKNNKLKPSIKLCCNLTYGLGDAAITGIVYGLIHNIYSYIQYYIYSYFKVKQIKFDVQPEFNKKTIYTEINSIIYINLVKIIYIFIIILISLHKFNKKYKPCLTKN